MVKIIEFVQCDCKEGKLELIASTQKTNADLPPMTYGEQKATYYYGCDKCDAVYAKFSEKSFISHTDLHEDFQIGDKIIPFKELRKYNGALTKEEIKKYAGEFIGLITAEEEKKIIAERKK